MQSWLSSLPAWPTALTVLTIALWATGRLPEYLTALLFFALAMILDIAPRDVIFSGIGPALQRTPVRRLPSAAPNCASAPCSR